MSISKELGNLLEAILKHNDSPPASSTTEKINKSIQECVEKISAIGDNEYSKNFTYEDALKLKGKNFGNTFDEIYTRVINEIKNSICENKTEDFICIIIPKEFYVSIGDKLKESGFEIQYSSIPKGDTKLMNVHVKLP